MHALSAAIQSDTVYAEEAPQWNLPPQLTRMLATTEDEELMGAIASLLAALSGATVHSERVVRVGYPEIGELQVSEAALGLGVGARLWGIAHRINTMLIAQRAVVAGRRVLELGSGVGSTGAHRSRRQAVAPLGVLCSKTCAALYVRVCGSAPDGVRCACQVCAPTNPWRNTSQRLPVMQASPSQSWAPARWCSRMWFPRCCTTCGAHCTSMRHR